MEYLLEEFSVSYEYYHYELEVLVELELELLHILFRHILGVFSSNLSRPVFFVCYKRSIATVDALRAQQLPGIGIPFEERARRAVDRAR